MKPGKYACYDLYTMINLGKGKSKKKSLYYYLKDVHNLHDRQEHKFPTCKYIQARVNMMVTLSYTYKQDLSG